MFQTETRGSFCLISQTIELSTIFCFINQCVLFVTVALLTFKTSIRNRHIYGNTHTQQTNCHMILLTHSQQSRHDSQVYMIMLRIRYSTIKSSIKCQYFFICSLKFLFLIYVPFMSHSRSLQWIHKLIQTHKILALNILSYSQSVQNYLIVLHVLSLQQIISQCS